MLKQFRIINRRQLIALDNLLWKRKAFLKFQIDKTTCFLVKMSNLNTQISIIFQNIKMRKQTGINVVMILI